MACSYNPQNGQGLCFFILCVFSVQMTDSGMTRAIDVYPNPPCVNSQTKRDAAIKRVQMNAYHSELLRLTPLGLVVQLVSFF